MALFKGSSRQRENQRSVDNSAKTLLANIRFMSVDNPIKTIVITSAIPNEGKTFIASNLARAMATSGKRTLLVEADMRRRSMARVLGAHSQHGLYAVLSGSVELEDAIVPLNVSRLFFLDAEPHIPNPSDLLNARRFQSLIEEFKESFDYIVFDTPPVGTFVDAAVLGSKADAVFMVIRERHTHRDEIVYAAEQLRTANVPLSGIVMNFCERTSSEYYYEYYYQEGGARRGGRKKSRMDLTQTDAAPLVDSINLPNSNAAPRSWSNAPDLGAAPAEQSESAEAVAPRRMRQPAHGVAQNDSGSSSENPYI